MLKIVEEFNEWGRDLVTWYCTSCGRTFTTESGADPDCPCQSDPGPEREDDPPEERECRNDGCIDDHEH